MRKYQQKQILEILESLGEAQEAGLFADCQDGALSIGEFIEDTAGEGTQTVALLEEYCELVYKASINEADNNALKKMIVKIEKSVRKELKPTKIEVVFLSYKASMSDSIESIYHSANDDPNCDAYWIPIPYIERNPDGTAKEMFLEGADCYEGIICTDWREYNIEERRPDAIFTFAPYDDRNYVTSVHPDFYCRRLRELTDMLVYVPYFVHAEDASANAMLVPGVASSHRTIVQSENIRQQYIQAILSYADGINKQELEKMIVALGSPKFDKAINSKKEDYSLPEEWNRLITSSKSKKLIVLYNNTLGVILQNTSDDESNIYMHKLRSVLDYFSKAHDVVLWWRPHPLTEQTLYSMRPNAYSEYMRIVEDYKAQAFGIFDDSPNLSRAIAWTDLCYGDWSSIMNLYSIKGKPTIFQSMEVHQYKATKNADSVEREILYQLNLDWNHYFTIYEVESDSEGVINLADYIKNYDVVMKFSKARTEKYRALIANSDGTAGKKIYKYIKGLTNG